MLGGVGNFGKAGAKRRIIAASGGGGGGGGVGGGSGTWYGNTTLASNSLTSNSGVGLVNIYYRRRIIAFCLSASELSGFGMSANDVISKLRWYVDSVPLSQYMPFPNYAIRMNHIASGTITTNPSGSATGTNITTVKAQHSYDANTPGTGYQSMDLDTNFTWNGTDAIGFVFAWGQIPTGYNTSGVIRRTSDGRLWHANNDNPGTYTVNDNGQAVSGLNYRPAIDMFVA